MSDETDYIDVPVTRRAHAVRIGMVRRFYKPSGWGMVLLPNIDIATGDELVVRVAGGGGFRTGVVRVVSDRQVDSWDAISGLQDGDLVYRVEPA